MAKCNICKKKINLAEEIISKCKCDKMHCSSHRLPEYHECKNINEMKEISKNVLAKSLPKVEGDKLLKI